MQFDQLLDFYMRKIFLEKSFTNSGAETIPKPFSESWNWTYLWINTLKIYTVCFYCMLSWGLSKYIEIKLQSTFL